MGFRYEEMSLTAPDGVQIPAWHIHSKNGATLIAAPGFNGNRSHALAEFGFLVEGTRRRSIFSEGSYHDELAMARLRDALDELRAGVIAVPPFEAKYLRRGHAVHFRCGHPEASGLRIDIMSRMRGVDSFSRLWRRRTSIELPDGLLVDLLSLPDLVRAKKTQRDKDWPMIRRLVERHYFENRGQPTVARVRFWLAELRTP